MLAGTLLALGLMATPASCFAPAPMSSRARSISSISARAAGGRRMSSFRDVILGRSRGEGLLGLRAATTTTDGDFKKAVLESSGEMIFFSRGNVVVLRDWTYWFGPFIDTASARKAVRVD